MLLWFFQRLGAALTVLAVLSVPAVAGMFTDEASLDHAYTVLLRKLPPGAKIIHAPYPEGLSVIGLNQRRRIVDDEDVPGHKALRVQVRRRGQNPWDVQARAPIGGEIAEGDKVFMAVWFRAHVPDEATGVGLITGSNIELNAAPYTRIVASSVHADGTWREYYASGVATRDYASGEAAVVFHLAAAKQTIEIGPVFVFDLGPDADLASLPKNPE